MKYEGKLYGKVGDEFFDTGYTSEDWDEMEARPKFDPETEVILPKRLTAENGSKYLLLGEFTQPAGRHEIVIGWSTIKRIYNRIVEKLGR